jgi:fumarate hydratase subunit beta
MKAIKLTTPLAKDRARKLKAGDEILLSGVILTARDAAHQRLSEIIRKGKRVPLNLKNVVLYYAGPTPATKTMPIGSCGPTTSSRMDIFTPELIRLGLSGMIGKGDRSSEVVKAMKEYGSVYFLAIGGIGALLSTKVVSAKVVLFKDLGPEAIYRLEVKDFPLIVGIDVKGRNIYDKARPKRR